MSRPPLEVADIIRAAGDAFIERNRHWLGWKHVKVLLAIARCRTAALGGHLDQCTRCGHRAISFNSCRNRHCPKCQTAARERWIAARQRELLPTRYLHVVFTLPRHLAPLVLQNKKVIYDLLFRTSAETLLEVARNPEHLGAEIGFFSVLHTWSQQLNLHPHVHCVVPAGGLFPDHTRWIHARENYFLPKKVLRKVFRGKFVCALERSFQNGQLNFYADGQVTFRWRDSADGNKQKLLPLSVNEFLTRFLLHILPQGFVRIRHFGFLANRRRTTFLPLCFQLLGTTPEPPAEEHPSSTEDAADLYRCPNCGGPMKIIERLTAAEIQLRSPPELTAAA